jgi:hypothetical protein
MDYSMLIGLAMSLASEAKAGKLSQEQQQMLQDIYDKLGNIPLPELQKIQAEQLGPTAMEGVHSDPEQRQQEMETMSSLRDLFEHGGFNIEDRAALNEELNRANVQGSAQRHALAGEFAQRGQLGSGARLALGNMDAQGAANRSNQAGLDIAAQGEKRRMDALTHYGDMASHLRGEDFGEASARAQAKDAADRWNASAREAAGRYNAGLAQQQFNNQVTKTTGQQSSANNLAAFYGNEAQGVRNQGANYARAAAEASKGFGSGGGNSNGGGGQKYDASGNPYDSDPSEWDNPYGGY